MKQCNGAQTPLGSKPKMRCIQLTREQHRPHVANEKRPQHPLENADEETGDADGWPEIRHGQPLILLFPQTASIDGFGAVFFDQFVDLTFQDG